MDTVSLKQLLNQLKSIHFDRSKSVALYQKLRADFLKFFEGVRLWAYDDATGKPVKENQGTQGRITVGVGFNMDAADAPKIWQRIVGAASSFQYVKAGQVAISQVQAQNLLDCFLDQQVCFLKKQYGAVWAQCPAHHRLPLESACFNSPALVKKGTQFHASLTQYYTHRRRCDFEKAVYELACRSNLRQIPGLQKRRCAEAFLLWGTGHVFQG